MRPMTLEERKELVWALATGTATHRQMVIAAMILRERFDQWSTKGPVMMPEIGALVSEKDQ